MLTLELDISDLERHLAQAERAYRSVPQKALQLINQAAQQLRATDPYQNRTGNLRRGTQAILLEGGSGDTVIVQLEMDEPYASYVIGRGYSNFWEVARLAEQWWVAGLTRFADETLSG